MIEVSRALQPVEKTLHETVLAVCVDKFEGIFVRINAVDKVGQLLLQSPSLLSLQTIEEARPFEQKQ